MTIDLDALSKLCVPAVATGIEKMHGDGSARTYWRVATDRGTLVLLSGPDRAENAAWLRIDRHLCDAGIRVPKVLGADEARGWILMEDLGDVSLRSWVKGGADARRAYREVIALLASMQTLGARGFSLAVGFADEAYGPRTMVELEGLYFLREFAQGVLGFSPDEADFRLELAEMAARAAKAPADFFLHRDFQSRNIQKAPDGWAVLDFQGARPGPLAYDAAALILDPYAALPKGLRDELWGLYFALLTEVPGVDVEAVELSVPCVSAFRLMQALGAYGKLGARLGKPGFLVHSGAALSHLTELMDESPMNDFSTVRATIDQCSRRWAAKS